MHLKKILIPLLLFASSYAQEPNWPTDAGNAYSSNFGEYRDDHFHMGLDIRTNGVIGHEVYAVEKGFISRIVTNYSGYGKAIYQKTISGKTIVYAHLDKFSPLMEKVVKLQQSKNKKYSISTNFSSNEFRITKGEVIGYTGETGYAFGPNLHFEVRDESDAALDPLNNGYLISDKVTPVMNKIALVPLSRGALINSSSLVQTIPLFRDKNGVYLFADTISVMGDFGLAIKAVDKREGSKYKYQFHKAELFVDNKPAFSLNYNRIPYNQTNNVRTLVQYELKKQNLGEYQKLYRLPEHPKMSVHEFEETGILSLSPGYHKIEIKITDAAGNEAIARGIFLATFPMSINVKEVSRDEKIITLAMIPIRGGLAIRDAVTYSFTPFGFPDVKMSNIHTQKVGKNLHISFPIEEAKDRILQILAINQIGAIAAPYHWSNYNSLKTVIDINPKLDIMHSEGGIFFQIEMDQYAPARVKLKLSNDNIFKSYPVTQIQPTVFLSDMLSPKILNDVKYVDVSLTHNDLSRETRFNFIPGVAEPKMKTVILSRDKNCSIQTLSNTVYSPTAVWIEKVDKHAPVKNGYHLSSVYQLQPFDRVLKDEFLIGLRYNHRYSGHSKMGIYYYDEKANNWEYVPTKNNSERNILTASLDQFHAITIIQDLVAPVIIKTFPANNGYYKSKDITKIIIDIDDTISGIEPKEKSFSIKLDGEKLFCAYQPVKKQISYRFDRGLSPGEHQLHITVLDKVGNKIEKNILFKCE